MNVQEGHTPPNHFQNKSGNALLPLKLGYRLVAILLPALSVLSERGAGSLLLS